MKEIKCPKCGSIFSVDESDYILIVNQIKNSEFNAEVERRVKEYQELNKVEVERLRAKLEQEYNTTISKKEQEYNTTINKKEIEIIQLNNEINKNEDKIKIAVVEEKNKFTNIMQEKDSEIIKLKNEITLKNNEIMLKNKESQIQEANLKKTYEEEKKILQGQIDYYKDLKAKMSTKMVGETLEQHCSIEFERYARPMLPNAYFGKDNDVIEGTKGDFIFRDKEDDFEYVSIMFEMKNEMDTTVSKHKNEDFLKKLDEDRKKKKCEYAVLVSLLEADNDLYNSGIVNMSHLYSNMYVIRPQFFIPFLMLIVNSSRKSLEYKKQLDFIQSKEIDITNFEKDLIDFQTNFGRNYRIASERFQTAIDEIDSSIKHLEKIKQALTGCNNNLRLANEKAEGLTKKKLTRNNPTMKSKFENLNKES